MILIADSGATKTTWVLHNGTRKKQFQTEGISPYFFTIDEIANLVETQVLPKLGANKLTKVYYYGTGCSNTENKNLVKSGLQKGLNGFKKISVESDMMAAAHALCGNNKGVACILGTGSNSCFYNGKSIVKNNPAPGFILGDEGSGAYLGKKVVQYFIYQTFDEDLMHKFNLRFATDYRTILDKVYKQPWPNRYLASFTPFLSENRGHYMIENIIEDGLSDFFFNHIYKYSEAWKYPINFSGSVAWHFKDVLKELCNLFELEFGRVLKEPMAGLIEFHVKKTLK